MITNYFGIITAFEGHDLLKSLTAHRGVSTVPIAGKYRAIDFPLSNFVNCGIKNVVILSEKNSRSLRTHVEMGKSWGLNRKNGGLFIHSSDAECDAKLLNENLEFLYTQNSEMVIIAPTYMIANIDFESAMEFHNNSNKDITVLYKRVPSDNSKNFLGCDVLTFDERNVLTRVSTNLSPTKEQNISMEIFLMKKDLLLSLIQPHENCSNSLKDIIYRSKHNLKIQGYEFKGYLSCLNTLANYFRTNMEVISTPNLTELFFNEKRPIFSKVKDSIPTHYFNGSNVKNSIISNECYIRGTVINSVLSRYVDIQEGAHVENCIILQNCVIKSGVKIKNLIIDKNVTVEKGTEIEGNQHYPIVIQKKFSL
nr:glucose-1-phosphate adenylyltransferase subunit GlgD [uncultured Cetobacterium sp.]